MMPIICYIHGANSSSKSFAWLKDHIADHLPTFVEYSCDTPLSDNIDRITSALSVLDEPVYLIGHSLGGVIAAAVAKNIPDKVVRLCTISAPFGGSRIANLLRWVTRSQLYTDINVYNPVLTALRATPVPVPHLAIITTAGGMPIMGESNDGVVTVSSQMDMYGAHPVQVPLNHFEVLMAEETATLVRDHFFGMLEAS